MIYIVIGLAGVAGSLLRFFIGLWAPSISAGPFPIGTLFCNLSGSFLLGMLFYYLSNARFSPLWYRGLGTGLLGSFTTFSAFSIETMQLMQEHLWIIAFFYIMASLWGGLMMSWLGYHLPRKFLLGQITEGRSK